MTDLSPRSPHTPGRRNLFMAISRSPDRERLMADDVCRPNSAPARSRLAAADGAACAVSKFVARSFGAPRLLGQPDRFDHNPFRQGARHCYTSILICNSLFESEGYFHGKSVPPGSGFVDRKCNICLAHGKYLPKRIG